jgi:hypothetical protein
MKTKAAFTLLLLTACGGNFSNEDVEFVSALPVRRDLESKLPQQTGQSLLQGTRQDAVTLGQPSQAYLDAKGASDAFNNGLFFLLDLIDSIRQISPTTREPDRRIWGPFPDKDHPDFIDEVVMERHETTLFDYRIEVRRKDAASTDPWTVIVKGSFQATGGARKGTGEVHLYAKAANDAGLLLQGLDALDTLDAWYVTDQSPIQVNMLFVSVANPTPTIVGYAYREYVDGHGEIDFIVVTGGGLLILAETAKWLPSGQGRADQGVLAGFILGAAGVECWDAQFQVTYSNKPWENPTTVGDPASCAF